jgi:GABA permease
MSSRTEPQPESALGSQGGDAVARRASGSRILVVANETVEGDVLHETVRARAGDRAEVLVVAPALNSRLHHWTSDEDVARAVAAARVRHCLERLRRAGLRVSGLVGDADPLLAIADALQLFAADEIVIATHPERRSHWLARGVVDRARARFGLPVLHIVVDRERRVEYLRSPAERDPGRLPSAA